MVPHACTMWPNDGFAQTFDRLLWQKINHFFLSRFKKAILNLALSIQKINEEKLDSLFSVKGTHSSINGTKILQYIFARHNQWPHGTGFT
jgi:hypothetical protein